MSRATLATRPARLAAWILDAVIAGVVFSPLQLVIPRDPGSTATFVVLFAAMMAAVFGYMIAFDGGPRGATPGKRILRMRVIDVDTGGPIGYPRAALRRLVYLLGGLALYVGWFWLLFDRRHQALHDKAARSLVVRASS
jgi:uncharacterized RDD family membrane protein YckC